MVHVNSDIEYGGQTFSYILQYSQQLSLIRKNYKSLVYNNTFLEDISFAAIKKDYTQEYNYIYRLFATHIVTLKHSGLLLIM